MAVSNPNQVVSGTQYIILANYYGTLRSTLNTASLNLYNAVYQIVHFDETEPTLDLLQTFYDVYNIQTQVLASNAPYIGAVRALNNHVLKRALDGAGDHYTDINNFFADENVPQNALRQEWADMCSEVGITIDAGYIN